MTEREARAYASEHGCPARVVTEDGIVENVQPIGTCWVILDDGPAAIEAPTIAVATEGGVVQRAAPDAK